MDESEPTNMVVWTAHSATVTGKIDVRMNTNTITP